MWDFGGVALVAGFADGLAGEVMRHFLSKPTKLDMENAIGDQLSIVSLTAPTSPSHLYTCLQDLLRLSPARFLSLFAPHSRQWPALLEKAVELVRGVEGKIRGKGGEMVEQRGKRWVWGEGFEETFHRELWRDMEIARVAGEVATQCVVRSVAMECDQYIHHTNSIAVLLSCQHSVYACVYLYEQSHQSLDFRWFLRPLQANMVEIYLRFKDSHPVLPRDAEATLIKMTEIGSNL